MTSYFYTYSVVTGYHLSAGKKMKRIYQKYSLFDLCPQWGEIFFKGAFLISSISFSRDIYTTKYGQGQSE
jgi:hypothetical protein